MDFWDGTSSDGFSEGLWNSKAIPIMNKLVQMARGPVPTIVIASHLFRLPSHLSRLPSSVSRLFSLYLKMVNRIFHPALSVPFSVPVILETPMRFR